MFKPGDIVVYGTTGVCRVDEIGPANYAGAPADLLYYALTPLIHGGVIYTPTNTQVSMRAAISPVEAKEVLQVLPTLSPENLTPYNVRELGERYAAIIAEGELPGYAKLAMSIHHRKVCPEGQRCRYGRVDVKYIKLAEELLCGELSVVLEREFEEVLSEFRAIAFSDR